MSKPYMKGSSNPKNVRKNKTYEKGRVCLKDRCTVVMSQYNKSKYCFHHSPRTYGRTRGKQLR